MGPIEGSPIPLMLPHRPEADAAIASESLRPDALRPETLAPSDAVGAAGKSFLELVAEAAKMGHHANSMAKDIAEGRSDDIHGTMIEMSKASIETRLAVNVKDKIIDAFYEIWRMSV
jgi:flagellar hook-basal body complex protein FliE